MDAPSVCAPEGAIETRSVRPVIRSRTNTSDTPLVSSGTRLLASDAKATNRPSAERLPPEESPFAGPPSAAAETSVMCEIWSALLRSGAMLSVSTASAMTAADRKRPTLVYLTEDCPFFLCRSPAGLPPSPALGYPLDRRFPCDTLADDFGRSIGVRTFRKRSLRAETALRSHGTGAGLRLGAADPLPAAPGRLRIASRVHGDVRHPGAVGVDRVDLEIAQGVAGERDLGAVRRP